MFIYEMFNLLWGVFAGFIAKPIITCYVLKERHRKPAPTEEAVIPEASWGRFAWQIWAPNGYLG
jgi:hypothetical protein